MGRLSPLPGVVVRDDRERTVTSQFLRDLGLPLAAITTFAELVDADAPPQAMHEALTAVADNARHALQLLRDFAHYQELSSGRVAAVHEPRELLAWLEPVLARCREHLASRDLALVVTWSSLVPSDTVLDADLAAAAIEAVVRVAGERAARGPVHLRVACVPAADGGSRLALRVTTRGGCFHELEASYAFVPFVAQGRDERPQLGLCLAHRWCELLGGELRVDVTGRDESVYEITLPAPPAEGSTWLDPLEPSRRNLGPVRGGRLAFAQGLGDTRLLCEPLLRRAGFSLVGVASLDDCLRLVHDGKTAPAGFVLGDLQGDVDAAAAAAALRREGYRGPVVLLGGQPPAGGVPCVRVPRSADGERLLAALRAR